MRKFVFELYDKEKHTTDIEYLMNNLRDEEIREMKGNVGLLKLSIEVSEIAYIAKCEDKPLFALGIEEENIDDRSIWLAGTNDLDNYKKEFIYYSKIKIKEFLDRYGFLCAYIPDWHEKTIRWLKFMGFKPTDRELFDFRRWEVSK